MITTEDKRRICARAFFQDNQDQYEDYHEAAAEMLSGSNVSDAFVDTVVEPFLRPEPGHVVVVNDKGHVATVREKDFFFSPRTEMTQDDGEEMEALNYKFAEEFPDLSEIELLQKMGWKIIDSKEVR